MMTEYDAHTRGRITFDLAASKFIPYTDRKLQRSEIVGQLIAAFGLSFGKTSVQPDPHYRS